MKDANPIALVDDLSDVLRRYIATTLPIGRRYPLLAERFREILGEQRLVEGPYVEALPDFEKGESLEALLLKNGGFVHDAMGNIPTAGRKLHRHQQRALELASREGRSLLVATGTGSGKTETFLYPIANQLLSDPEPEKPGVRALLVYPMNALANDQLYYRIAPLFARHLQQHGITFGRYTGQVKAKVKREEEEARLLSNTKLMDALGYALSGIWLLVSSTHHSMGRRTRTSTALSAPSFGSACWHGRATMGYLASYDEANHSTVRAREHTASLSTELRESIERDFAERKINLLCCTTTMEMGVDLGDLEAVVNLNVPPGIANYQQRTGRAGRRAQAAPFCVTVARNTNFDQMVVRDFPRYLASSPGTPFIHLDNQELFTRHQFSVLLSHFLRKRIANGDINAPSLKHFFGETFTRDDLRAFTECLMQWLEAADGRKATDEAESLCEKLPRELAAIGARGMRLRELFLAAVREFAEEVYERFGKYSERITEAATASDYKKAGYWQGMRDDFMGQFLVEQLSRRGLIPTYSFPVHSLNLEVLNDASGSYFGSKSEVVLSRDASLGISEYAPGAEVVANGRIWESAGLAHYPKAFMPERWYVACPECFHVDIGDSMEDVPPVCSNCGSMEGRRKRKFVEPHGFVTSFADRRGRDPGSSRRRVKAADEAKLIAAPRDDVFEDTGLRFLNSALLSAKARGDGALTGALFIANRGAYGEGYRRCYVCNYCEPVGPQVKGAKAAANKGAVKGSKTKFVHKDPQTGLTCKNDVVSQGGLDFVHQFHTDVRILRFVQAMPEPESSDMVPRRYHERVARTVSEALRLAATRLLSLHPGEIRAIYRLSGARGSALEVVLYDGVPGGAGYCARIGEPGYSFSALIEAARKSLNCPEECESGCRVCLCDYANQRYWDSFERRAALSWLNALADPTAGASAPGNYIRWAAPSIAGLADRLANYNEISFVVRSLVDVGDVDENSMSQLLNWLQSGKTVNVYLANRLDEKPRAQAPLTAYRRLQPYVFEGRLRLFAISEQQSGSWQNLPRIFAGTGLNMPVVRQYFAAQSLLEQMIAGPADIGAVDELIREELTALSAAAVPYGVDALKEGERMGMWELREGEPRKLDDIFAPLKGSYVKRLEIRDPYCAAPANVGRLEAFLAYARSAATSIEYLNIRCRETKERDGYVEFYLDVERRIDGVVRAMGFENRDIEVIPLKRSSKSFHDREIDITIVSADGCEEVHRYFLTGGVDYLLNEKVQTRVFYLRLR